MNLFDQISEDIKQAMLAKDKVALVCVGGGSLLWVVWLFI